MQVSLKLIWRLNHAKLTEHLWWYLVDCLQEHPFLQSLLWMYCLSGWQKWKHPEAIFFMEAEAEAEAVKKINGKGSESGSGRDKINRSGSGSRSNWLLISGSESGSGWFFKARSGSGSGNKFTASRHSGIYSQQHSIFNSISTNVYLHYVWFNHQLAINHSIIN